METEQQQQQPNGQASVMQPNGQPAGQADVATQEGSFQDQDL